MNLLFGIMSFCSIKYEDQGVNWWGLVGVTIFYIAILVGIFASWKNQKRTDCEEVMLAGRNIGLFVGIFTMTGNGHSTEADVQNTYSISSVSDHNFDTYS